MARGEEGRLAAGRDEDRGAGSSVDGRDRRREPGPGGPDLHPGAGGRQRPGEWWRARGRQRSGGRRQRPGECRH